MLPAYQNPEVVLQLIDQAFIERDQSLSIADLLQNVEHLEDLSLSEWCAQLPNYLVLSINERDGEQAFCVDFIISSLHKNSLSKDFPAKGVFNDEQGEAVYYTLRYLAHGDWNLIDIIAIQKVISGYWLEYANLAAQRLISLLNTSFQDIRKGRMTLYEAEARDDYRDATEEEKNLENSKSWQEVRTEDIRACTSALHFLDPDSWRYYIPAYMRYRLSMLRGDDNVDPVFALTRADHTEQMQRWVKLNKPESHAVYHFLVFILDYQQMFIEDQISVPAYWEAFK